MKKSNREQAIEKIILKLQADLSEINYKIFKNKFEFKKLAEEQTILKRQRVEITQIIRDLTKKKEK